MENIQLRSGAGDIVGESAVDTAASLLVPCLEAAAIIAVEYSRACGRDVVLSRDFQYGLKFAARHVLGKQLESLFSDDESDDDEEADDAISVDEDEEVWTRYDGDDSRLRIVNEAAESWDGWVPETDVERAIKQSIDSADNSA